MKRAQEERRPDARRAIAAGMCLGFAATLIGWSSFVYLAHRPLEVADHILPFAVLAFPVVFGFFAAVAACRAEAVVWSTFAGCWLGLVAGAGFLWAGNSGAPEPDYAVGFLFNPPRDAARTVWCLASPGAHCVVLVPAPHIPFRGEIAARACRSRVPGTYHGCSVAMAEGTMSRSEACRINAAAPTRQNVCSAAERANIRRNLGLFAAPSRR